MLVELEEKMFSKRNQKGHI